MTNAYVVLGDVVRSRGVEDRESLQRSLEAACEAASAAASDVVAPFAVLKGVDEVGGVLDRAADLYRVARTFAEHLRPHRVRLAVARGTVDVGVETGDVSRMDGEAFHDAADLLDEVERAGLLFDLDAGSGRLDAAVADEVNLLLERRHDWTDHQRRAVERYEALGSQRAVAEDLDVTQQAVSKSLRAASYGLVAAVEERLDATLRDAFEGGESP